MHSHNQKRQEGFKLYCHPAVKSWKKVAYVLAAQVENGVPKEQQLHILTQEAEESPLTSQAPEPHQSHRPDNHDVMKTGLKTVFPKEERSSVWFIVLYNSFF